MKQIFLLIVFLFPMSAFAQQESNISSRDDTTQHIMSQNRRLLLNKFYTARLDSVSLLLDSMDRHYYEQPLLFPAERLLLYYWIERYDAIDSLVHHFDDFCEKISTNPPSDQMIWNALSYYSQEKRNMLVEWIDQTGCSDDVFDFRMLLLKILLQNELQEQSSIEEEIRTFINQFSSQENEISFIEAKEVKSHEADSPWRIGIGLGFGAVSISGKIDNYLSPKFCGSFDLSVNYERWYFLMLLQFAFPKLKQDVPFKNGDGVWEAGKTANIFNFNIAVGYSVINSRFFRTSPFVGLAISECAPGEIQIEKDDTLNDAGISGGISNIIGLDTDINLYQMINPQKQNKLMYALNVRINYIPSMFSNVNSRYSGNMLFISFGAKIDFNWI